MAEPFNFDISLIFAILNGKVSAAINRRLIRNFRENKAIPLRAKIISLVLMWGTMLYCIFFLIPFIWVKILLGLIAAGVTYHILSFKTLK